MITKTATAFIKAAFNDPMNTPGAAKAMHAMKQQQQFRGNINNAFSGIAQANQGNALGTVANVGQKAFNIGSAFLDSVPRL